MTNDQKAYFYYVTFSFKTADGQLGFYSMDLNLNTDKININLQKELKEHCLAEFKAKNNGLVFSNFNLISISPLGYMSADEYQG
ncbi:hypothetical protein [Acinetobacter oleivorans]|uniref:hypothetical protein n=1 Tax=Acinetobacter oleivorans TaxID=1148157 RepID=UPI0011A74217|nr:hypothetical protein [Acinetobacter oleivorans]